MLNFCARLLQSGKETFKIFTGRENRIHHASKLFPNRRRLALSKIFSAVVSFGQPWLFDDRQAMFNTNLVADTAQCNGRTFEIVKLTVSVK